MRVDRGSGWTIRGQPEGVNEARLGRLVRYEVSLQGGVELVLEFGFWFGLLASLLLLFLPQRLSCDGGVS